MTILFILAALLRLAGGALAVYAIANVFACFTITEEDDVDGD